VRGEDKSCCFYDTLLHMRTCRSCKEEFSPSSRHLNCPRCRAVRYNECICGERKAKEAPKCRACTDYTGSANGNWKGGVARHKKGYVMRRIDGHPRGGPYVFEHILVMEDHLGRFLSEGENVHHMNGVKGDNRLENLELWIRPQPAGIRARDAVAWANEILSKYGDIDATPTTLSATG
jgi:hypothetical protein